MNYSRNGIYIKRNKKKRVGQIVKKKTDWWNIFLFILLGIVVFVFVFFR